MLLTMVATTSEMWGQTRDVQELTNANIVAAGNPDGGYKDWTITDNNDNEWNAYAIKNKHSNATSAYHYLQIKKYASNTAYYIQLPELGTKITSITMTVSSSNQPMTGGGNIATLFFSNSNSTSSSGSGVVSGTGASSVTIDCTSLNLNTGYITSSGAVRIWDISVSYTSGGGSTPSISADDVNIAYDAMEGGIAYTINNPVEGGALGAEVTDGDWLSLGQGTASPIAFTCSANEASVARTATVRLTYTYNAKAIVTKDVTITQAAAPVIYTTIPEIFAAATATETDVHVTFDNWVVSGVSTNGKNVYVTDNNGNGFIMYYTSDMSSTFSAGSILSGVNVSCTLKLYNGAAELLNVVTADLTITSGGTVTPANIAMADLTGVNTGTLLHYEDLTCTSNNNKYFLTDGTTSIQLYNSLYDFTNPTVGNTYNITGVYAQYNTTKEIMPRSAADIEEVLPTEPSITVANATVNVEAEGGEGTLTVTYENITDVVADVWFCNSAGTASATYDWIDAEIDNQTNNVEYLVNPNDGEERTAYFKVWAYDNDLNEVYSNLVSVTQAEYVAPTYAELPFSFNGGRADIEDTDGLSQEGLGSDYSSDPKLKFDSTGDWLLLQFSESPGTLTFDIKGNGFSGGTFKVQTSTDGTTYTDLETYDALGDTQTKEFTNLDENVRYIKWIYTEKSSGNVGLGNIILAKVDHTPSITINPGPYNLNANGGDAELPVTYNNMPNDPQAEVVFFESNGETPLGENPTWITATINNAGNVDGHIDANTGAARSAYFKVKGIDANNSPVYSELVTINQAAYTLSIVFETTSLDIEAGGEQDRVISFEYQGLGENPTFTVRQYDASGETQTTYDWLTTEITQVHKVNITVSANTGAARSAYFKVYGENGPVNTESNLVTINQAAYVASYTVTFDCDGGTFVPNTDFATVNESKVAGTYNLPSATKDGWQFAGWNDGTTTYEANAEYNVASAVDFTAQWAVITTGTIYFGNNGTKISAEEVTGDDSMGNTWTITSVFGSAGSSFTQSSDYAQVGSGNKPATSITFTTTLASSTNITAFSAKFGGFNGTIGDVTLKVGETTVGSGALNGTTDVVVENTSPATGTVLTVTVTNIAKGVKCYYISYTISAGSDPMIVAQNSIELSSTDTYGEFDYSIVNPVPEVNLTASSTDEWISNINVTAEKVTFVTTPNTSTTDNREGTITLSYPNASNKNVTVTQSKVDYATMPFEFVGNEATIPTGVSTDAGAYNTSPYLKFDATGKYLVLKLVEAPVSISYDIKGNNFSGGTFKVQVSANDSEYTDVETYTSLGDTQTITLLNSDDNVRYIKWVYTKKVNGNVALGNLNVTTELIINGDCTVDNITISNTEVLTIEAGSVMTITGTLTNEGDASNLIIEDGGQLIHNGNVTATLKKNVAGYNTRSVSGWYTIASPVANMDVNCATTGTYDFFAFNEENTKWLNQKVGANNITNFEQGVGYLYANADATVIDYLGTLIGTETEVTKPLSYACENASYQGINLMGNPFSRNLVAGNIEIAGTPLTTYYTVEGGNELTAKTLASTPIKPGQGFMVQTTASSQNLVFNPTSKDRSAAKVGYISIVAGNSEFTDNAFVQVGGGNTLHKMTLSDNSSIVYVMNNGNDYAAATIDALEGSMPVCFKANALGSYTITIEAIDINADYLHLIDNFTGEDINLLLEPSYSFIASNGDRAERFTLVFRSNGSEGTTNDIFAFQNGSDIVVNGEGELQVFDVTGRMVATQHVNGVQTVNVPSQGVFIFKLNEKTQKIVVR